MENQQTQPTYDAGSGNRTRDTLEEGERSHHSPGQSASVSQSVGRSVRPLVSESVCLLDYKARETSETI